MTALRVARFALAASLLATPAWAEDPTPGELFRQGSAKFDAKHFGEAAELFERAFRAAPTSQAAYNAGLAWDAANERARAANALTRAVNLGELSSDELREVSERLARLVPTLGKIVLASPRDASVKIGDIEQRVPGVIYVEPGEHALEAALPDGSARRKKLTLGAGETRTLELDAEIQPKPAPEAATTTTRAPSADPPEVDEEPSSGPPILAYGALGLAAIAVGTGVFLNLRGIAANDAYEESNRKQLDDRDRAVDLRTGAFIAYGVGAAFGAVGVVLLLSDSGADRGASRLGVAPTGVSYELQF